MEEINLKELFDYIKEKWLIILIVVLSFLSITFVYDKFIKVKTYSTYTTIALVKSNADTKGLTQSDIQINQSLINTYSEIVKSKKVLNQVMKELDIKYSIKELSNKIEVNSVNDTEIIKIKVTDTNSKDAYLITNSVSKYFIKEVNDIYQMENVSVVDSAEISNEVSNNTLIRDLAIAILFGIASSSLVLFIIFYFDDRIKYNESFEEEIGLPVVSTIFKSRINDNKKRKIKTELIVNKYPKSVVSESIKNLRTNLQFSSIDKTLRTLLITSSIPAEGKSFISSNLAISFAQANKRVLLIDCDMRKGRLHKIFRLNNTNGYSNLLVDKIENYKEYIKKTNIPNLSVITRGTIPPNPSELLNSTKNKELIKELKKHFDKIIFDGVPCSGLTDSVIMSSLVDKVAIITSNKYCPKTELMNTINTFKKANASIAGIIVNNINSNKGYYGKYYYYYGDKK